MKRIYFVFALVFLLISMVSATSETLGQPIKLYDVVNLQQTCANCSYNNVTTIRNPLGNLITINDIMTKDGTSYNYSLDGNYSSQIGTYVVNGIGDPSGVQTTWQYSYEVTPSGFVNTLGLYIVFLIILTAIIILGFSIKEVWFVVLGGMGLIAFGVYSMNYGIVGFRDTFMTWATSLFEISVGAILAIGAAWQKIDSD